VHCWTHCGGVETDSARRPAPGAAQVRNANRNGHACAKLGSPRVVEGDLRHGRSHA
jgi:hypothetical protein